MDSASKQQPGGMAPDPGGKGGSGKMIAIILGAVAVLAIGAIVAFFALSPDSPEPATRGLTPSGAQAQFIPPGEEEQPPPQEGGLVSIVQEQVGNYTLQEVQENSDAVSAGATEALIMLYASPDGAELQHGLEAWSSPEQANSILQALVEYLVTEEGFQVVGEGALTDEQGQQIGAAVALQAENGAEAVIWSNAQVTASVVGPQGYAVDFFNNAPY